VSLPSNIHAFVPTTILRSARSERVLSVSAA
jgi:hypothetical protein